MKLLLDMNISPRWVKFLHINDVEAMHWLECSAPNAPDSEIMSYAREMEFGIHQYLARKWKALFKESASGIFTGAIDREDAKRERELHDLHARIGQLTVKYDFLAQAWEKR